MALSDEQLKKIDPVLNLESRLTWRQYYMAIAFLVSQRSFDPSSRCGCVLVSKDNRILATGYNGPIKNSIDEKIPLTRPDRYCHMIHAEENALLSYSGSYQDIQNATAYITNRPCHRCLRGLLQKGITEFVYSSTPTNIVGNEDLDAQKIMLSNRSIKMICIPETEYKDLLLEISNRVIQATH